MSQPTEGPYAVRRRWTADGTENLPWIVPEDGHSSSRLIAHLCGAPDIYEDTLANAALLAASWELRRELAEELRDARDRLRRHMGAGTLYEVRGLQEKVERWGAVLAKADGQGGRPMSDHDATQRMIDDVSRTMRDVVGHAAVTIADMDGLAASFREIESAIGKVVDVLGRMNERMARLENKEKHR